MYLNLIQIAESFGVSERIVEGWIRDEGLPHTADRGRYLFDRAQVVQWAATRGLATRAGFLAQESSLFSTGFRLEPLLRAGGIWRNIESKKISRTLSRVVASLPGINEPIRQLLDQRLGAAGGITWAPVGGGFALPHLSARIAMGRNSGTVALILLSDSLAQAEPTPDGKPVRWLFFFIAPSPRAHLDLLGRLTRALATTSLRDQVAQGASDAEILKAASHADNPTSMSVKS